MAAGGAWAWYASQDLVLSHYDAKAHLVVARRVLDSLTPGWKQLGAVWLPLPHLVNLLPVQVDLLYRTGAFASLVSIACFGLTVWAAARLTIALTGSWIGAVTCAGLLVLNPNVLYLHVTPMTEPMAMAAAFLVVLWLYEWLSAGELRSPRARLGLAMFAAVWTRYEAWLVVAAGITAAIYVLARRGAGWRRIGRAAAALAAWPVAAVLLFVIYSRLSTGVWFVTGGFYEVDPYYHGHPWRSLRAVWWGTHRLSGYVIATVAMSTAGLLAYRAVRQRPVFLVPLALFAAAALPFYAFAEGHPFRIRYMVPVVAACALLGGVAVGAARGARFAGALAALLIGSSVVESPPWNTRAPMLVEAQLDVPRSLQRRQVTACLADRYRGERVFASMASLAHYMHELSHEGFDIADFVHEGNGTLWLEGLQKGAAAQAGWLLIEEQSEGGDVLSRRAVADPGFAQGMTRVCEGGGVALYQRDSAEPALRTSGRP